MARLSGPARLGIALGILVLLALIAHLAGINVHKFLGKLHGH
jgi:hypothetical protein